MAMRKRGRRSAGGIMATERSFRIVELLMERGAAGVTEVARDLDISKSTAHEHLTTLDSMGYVRRDGDGYRVGLAFLTLGGYAQARTDLYRHGYEEVDDIAEETGEKANLVVELDGHGLYLYQRRGTEAVRTDSHLGTSVGLHETAAGKAILSRLGGERVREIASEHGLPASTEHTITDLDDLLAELETIRSSGVAFDDQERMLGIRCVAAPIVRDGRPLGALSVSGPTKRINGERFRETLPNLVRDTARIIEIASTYARDRT